MADCNPARLASTTLKKTKPDKLKVKPDKPEQPRGTPQPPVMDKTPATAPASLKQKYHNLRNMDGEDGANNLQMRTVTVKPTRRKSKQSQPTT